jgi:tetratricopeptide (TPR) repeat protein
MRRILLIAAIAALTITVASSAQPLQSLDEARQMAEITGKPLLLEFYHEDCEYCADFAADADTSRAINAILDSVVHYSLSVLSEEGDSLSDVYEVGYNYPVFIVMNNKGEVVKRWTGYSTPMQFALTLRNAIGDLSTIGDRLSRFRANPTYEDALFLAKYYADSGEDLDAIEFYRKADSINAPSPIDHSFEIFSSTANAVWRDELPYNDALTAADAVLNSRIRNSVNVAKVGNLLAQVARRVGRTETLKKYLQAGIEATSGSTNSTIQAYYVLLKADYALHVDGDTAEAVRIKKESQGPGWEQDRDKFYSFARWCLQRKIDLEEAEMYARKAINLVYPGRARAIVYNTLAEICAARGERQKALKAMELAVRENPDNEYYRKQLEEFREKAKSAQ